jgi:hypothetical protein
LLSEVVFGALLAYSPRGPADVSQRSRSVCYNIKAGDPATLRRAMQLLREHVDGGGILSPFFGQAVALVPMPRSAPLVAGALWPAEIICRSIVGAGLVRTIVPCLRRNEAVPKSARAPRGERPGVSAHFASMDAESMVGVADRVLVVDDVITKGSTALAAASRLVEVYPNADVKIFALVRTKGLVVDIERIFDPATGNVRLVGDEGDRQP